MAQALHDNRWVLGRHFPAELPPDFLRLWRLMQNVTLSPTDTDSIRWTLTTDGLYSAKSAYRLQFEGQIQSIAPNMIWKIWAPARCKITAWLLLHDRLWCEDHLQRRGWPNEYFCQLCVRNLETSRHLFFSCPLSRSIWATVSNWPNCRALLPSDWGEDPLMTMVWQLISAKTHTRHARGLSSMFILVCSEIWRERNSRIFQQKARPLHVIAAAIHDEASSWAFAGAKALRELLFEPP